jgi:predicted CopG family antitoxin
MPRRTTIILEEDVYEMLVRESIKRYGTARALSKVLNEILRGKRYEELLHLLSSEKTLEISQEEFENFRKKLSRRFEER